MKFNKFLALITLSMASSLVAADDYRAEVGVGYLDIEDVNGYLIMGEFHFNEVSTSGHPLEEAGFLEKSNNVYASYRDVEDSDVSTIGAEFFINQFYISGSYVDSDVVDGVAVVGLGYMPMDGLLIRTHVPEEDYGFNIDAKYVTALSNGSFINLEAGYVDGGDSDDIITVGGDYYIDTTLSIGAAIISADDTAYKLRVNKFFTGSFRGGLNFTSSDDFDIIAVDASIRF